MNYDRHPIQQSSDFSQNLNADAFSQHLNEYLGLFAPTLVSVTTAETLFYTFARSNHR